MTGVLGFPVNPARSQASHVIASWKLTGSSSNTAALKTVRKPATWSLAMANGGNPTRSMFHTSWGLHWLQSTLHYYCPFRNANLKTQHRHTTGWRAPPGRSQLKSFVEECTSNTDGEKYFRIKTVTDAQGRHPSQGESTQNRADAQCPQDNTMKRYRGSYI